MALLAAPPFDPSGPPRAHVSPDFRISVAPIPPNTPVIPGDCAPLGSQTAARANSGVSGLWPHPVRRVDFCRPCYGLSVAKQAATTTFIVEHTNDGWSVGAGIERMGCSRPSDRSLMSEENSRRKGQASPRPPLTSLKSGPPNRTLCTKRSASRSSRQAGIGSFCRASFGLPGWAGCRFLLIWVSLGRAAGTCHGDEEF